MPNDDMMMMEDEYSEKAGELQDETDDMLVVPKGNFSKAVLNGLVAAFNTALTASGFEGNYPKFTSDQTSLPLDLVRGLAMMADAAAESDSGIVIELENVSKDRDIAMLAAQVKALAESEEFAAMMTEAPEIEVSVEIEKQTPEQLMMERA